MLLFLIGLFIGIWLCATGGYFVLRRIKKLHDQQVLLYARELGTCITEEEFEKLAHAIQILKWFEKTERVSIEDHPDAAHAIKEADKVISENKLCPLWYGS